MLTVLFLMTQLAAGEDFAQRLAVLEKHVERLHAITVGEDTASWKAEQLAALGKAVAEGVDSQEAFDKLYYEIDDVRTRLLAASVEKPSRAEGSFVTQQGVWSLDNPHLKLALNSEDLSLTVEANGKEWRTEPCGAADVERNDAPAFSLTSAETKKAEAFHTGYSVGMAVTLADFPKAPGLELSICINLIGQEVVIEIAAPGDIDNLATLNWPKPFINGNTDTDWAVIPHMQGMLLRGNWQQEVHAADLSNSRTLYMPWWGQVHDGQGVLTILETSDDGGAAYHHNEEGTRIQPRWWSCLGQVGYPRVMRLVFGDEASSYVKMAKRYRRYVKEMGRLVTLAEKRVRTPALDEVIGKPVIHLGALYHFVQEASLFNKERIENNHSLNTFDELAKGLRELKARGLDDAYVHLDGWGFYGYDNGHPDVLPVGEEQGGWEGLKAFADTCDELGYLFAVHDQYRDFYLNAVSFDDRMAATRWNGKREEHAVWCGGPQTILSAWFAPGYVRRNHDLFAEHGIKVRGAYLDVFSVVPVEESWQRTQPMTRSECAARRRECFDILRARGYVVSSEEPSDYLVRSLDLVHHGPYPTHPNIGGGDNKGLPVPLFNLVYHDCLLTPWDMGEDGGWGIPNGDAGRLHCVLNAGLPYAGVGSEGEALDRVHEAAALAQRCALLEMTNHEYLGDGFRKQRSTFADGTQVTVDFDTKEYSIEYP